jgi:glutamate-1-semialdehyde 2,1-aminomutase
LNTTESAALYERACAVIPGGVQGDARRCDPYPLYFDFADGPAVQDADGNYYRDFHAAFGAELLGHNHPAVRSALTDAINGAGITYGACHRWEVELAENLVDVIPGADRFAFPTTGSEATAFCMRLARAYTGRDLILKFEGNYHGSTDIAYSSVSPRLDLSGRRERPATVPGSAGMVPGAAEHLIVREYNDIKGTRSAMADYGDRIAAIIVEPIYFNGGVIEPIPGFLAECRKLCDATGALLIFDQLITGFRVDLGGAAVSEKITPDLSAFGKALSNGMPLAAIGGQASYMEGLSPLGPAYFSGTHAGHMLSVRAALACVRTLISSPPYEHLDRLGAMLSTAVNDAIADLGIAAQLKYRSGVFALYLTDRPVRNYRDLLAATSGKAAELQSAYLRILNRHRIYMHPFFVLRGYVTAAHTPEDIRHLIHATIEFLHAHRDDLRASDGG